MSRKPNLFDYLGFTGILLFITYVIVHVIIWG